MRKLALAAAGALLLAPIAAFATYGGWAVVKVAKIPDAWVAGKPLQLSWQTRQHGVSPLAGLRPTLEARSGDVVVRGTTWESSFQGESGYSGRIVFPRAGEWQVTIHSGFGTSSAVLVPWRVVDSVSAVRGTVEEHLASIGVPRFDDAERGRRLFAAQGCVTCHVHRALALESELAFGPELTGRRFPADYLARFLADPSIKPSAQNKGMPNLALRDKEIAMLVAFINAERQIVPTSNPPARR